MRRYFTDDSFEDFLKQNADRLQMRPSDKVWQGITANLKRRNRRIGWIASLLLLLTSVSGYFLAQYQTGSATRPGLAQSPGAARSSARTGTATSASGNSSRRLLTPGSAAISESTTPATNTRDVTASGTSSSERINRTVLTAGNDLSVIRGSAPAATVAGRNSSRTSRSGNNPLRLVHTAYRTPSTPALTGSEAARPVESFDPGIADHFRTNAGLEQPAVAFVPTADAPVSGTTTADALKLKKPAKMSLQFFFTPTVSYRKLSENKDYTSTTPQSSVAPNYAALYNINDAVTHKPNIGLEVGLTAKYPVARNLKVQGGVQFNMSRYDVHVFNNHWVNEAAMMALRDGRTSMRATPYSNFNGSRRDWLQNLYFQVSVPLGMEVKLAGNDKASFGIASTVQPTYLLSDRVFVLSTDYKNYAEVPWLMRRLNVNSSLTTYVSYSTGKVNWQMGPQIRYQLLSSFVDKYPVKENLFDFGLRVGVTFNKPAAKARN